MCFSSVVLPQPEPPRITNTSPAKHLEIEVVQDHRLVVAGGEVLDTDDGFWLVHQISRMK